MSSKKTPKPKKRKADEGPAGAILMSTPAAIRHVAGLRKESAGSLSGDERTQLYELVAEAVRTRQPARHAVGAVDQRLLEEDSRAKTEEAKEARDAKRRRAAAPEKDRDGARLASTQAPSILRKMPAAVAAETLSFLEAEDLRRLGELGAWRGAGGAAVLRATVAKAIKTACAFPTSAPQLQLASAERGYEPLAVVEDARRAAGRFFSAPRRDWHGLQRVRPITALGLLGRADEDLDDERGPPRYCPPFELAFERYCAAAGPATRPAPRCCRDATVAATVCAVLRRAPDALVARSPGWLGQFWTSFLADDVYRLDDATEPSRLALLDAAGFAEALVAALGAAREARTTRALAEALLRALYDGHAAGLAAPDAAAGALGRWKRAAAATLAALLALTRGPEGRPDRAESFLAFWRFADFFLLTRNRDYLLGPADVWAAVDADPEARALRWACDQLEPPRPAEVGCEAETAVMAVTSLARASDAAKLRMVSLGALEKCAKIRDGSTRVTKHFCSIANRLHKQLTDALKREARDRGSKARAPARPSPPAAPRSLPRARQNFPEVLAVAPAAAPPVARAVEALLRQAYDLAPPAAGPLG